MKRSLLTTAILLIIFYFIVFLVDGKGQICEDPITGDGSQSTPYLIYNAVQLEKIDSLGLDKYYKLMCHIDYEGGEHTQEGVFTGQLDGNFYEIRNLVMNFTSETRDGFFTFVGTAISSDNISIKNLTIRNWTLNKTSSQTFTGLFGGQLSNNSFVWDVHARQCSVVVSGSASSASIGMFFGTSGGTNVDIQWSSVDSCYVYRAPTAGSSSGSYMGGFFGKSSGDTDFRYCYVANTEFYNGNSGGSFQVTGAFYSLASTSGFIFDCYALNNSYNSNNSNGTWGGFIDLGNIGTFTRSYTVLSTDAGLSINNEYYTISGTSSSDNWEGCYFDTTGTTFANWTVSATGGNIRNTTQMKDSANYVDRALGTWFEVVSDTNADGSQVWYIDPLINDGYPYLQYAALDTVRPPNPPTGGYFRLVDLRPDTNAGISENSTVGIGWETNDAEFIEFDSISIPYSSGEANIDRLIDSTLTGGDSVYIVARGLNVTAVFDSVYSRPNPTDDTSHITGSGTLVDPYVLYNAIDLDSTRLFGTNKYYALGANIDMSPYPNWSSHLTYRWSRNHFEYPNFGYGLDGRGYTIKNLVMTSGTGGGPTTFISLRNSDNNHVKNVIFDSCSISMTDNPYGQILAGEFWYNDNGYVLGIDRTNVTFIESNQLVDNVVFTNCSISVNMDTLYSYIRVGYVYKANDYAIDTLRRVGLENCTFNIDIDAVKIYDQSKSYRDFYIAMLSPTTTFSQGGICWIDSNSIMTVDIGSFTNRDTTLTHALYMGSIASGSGATMYDVNADGIYSWTVSSDWLGRIDTTSYRRGYYGLLSGFQPRATSYNGGKNYMKRNIFNGKLTTNIDTLSGVTYNATGGTLFRMGSSYYNTDSANVSGTFKIYQDNIFVGTAIDSNGVITDSLKLESSYKYAIYHERFTQIDTVNQWDFTYGNWRMNSENRGYPHIYGQNGIADTNWTYTITDTVDTDTLVIALSASIGCGITYEINIDTVAYVQDPVLSINRIDIVTETYYIDSLDLYYAYTDEVDTSYSYLGRSPISNTQSYWDTTTFSYDITETGIEATRPMVFKASVDGIFPLLDEYKEGDVEDRTALPDHQMCQTYKMLVNRGGIGWRRIKDATCGWVGGAHVTLGEGSYTAIYNADPPSYTEQTLKTTFSSGSSTTRRTDFNTACRPSGHRGYNLDWDRWLCDFREADTLTTVETYEQCGYLFTYAIAGTTVTFHNTFDDSTRVIATLSSGSGDYSLSLNTQTKVGAVGGTTGFGWMVIFKLSLLSTSADPAEAVYYYGTPGGEGGEPSQPLGNILSTRFRGIHPKILKWGRADGTRPDSIWIMTTDGPVKVKL